MLFQRENKGDAAHFGAMLPDFLRSRPPGTQRGCFRDGAERDTLKRSRLERTDGPHADCSWTVRRPDIHTGRECSRSGNGGRQPAASAATLPCTALIRPFRVSQKVMAMTRG